MNAAARQPAPLPERAASHSAASNIICFAKDWSEDPTSNHHVMEQLGRTHRVLWLNSIAMRAPQLTSGRDIRKILSKVIEALKGPRQVRERLWVYSPLVLPFPHSRRARAVNKALLRFTLAVLRWRLRMREFQLWTFLPTVGEYVGTLGESVSVYYCVDQWSGFSYLDGDKIAAAEESICRRVDIVFVTTARLAEQKRRFNCNTFLAPHGVDYDLFRRAIDGATEIPPDVAALPQPVLGFYGTIQDWVDQDLLVYLAERHPEWSIVLLGPTFVDVSRLERLPNIHLLGRKRHEELAAYCKSFAVGLIPYVISDRMLAVNPLKLREYLCAGLPVVSTPVPEVEQYRQHCTVARNHSEFERGVEEALRTASLESRHVRSEAMRSETWERRVAALIRHIDELKESGCQSKPESVLAS